MLFQYNVPAILHKGALIVGDLHFGIEERMHEKRVFASNISESLANKLLSIVKKTKAKRLFILGDVKDNVTCVDDYPLRAFEILASAGIPISVVRGNHDGGIERLEFLGIGILSSKGIVYEGLGLAHGHSWPGEECMQEEYLISAHQHPQIEFVDKSGKRHTEPAWFVAGANFHTMKKHYKSPNKNLKIILMPAFNPLVGSNAYMLKSGPNPVNSRVSIHLGPLLRNKIFKWEDAIIYRLTGEATGKIKWNNIK